MSLIPVVNYGRMERLRPAESKTMPMNLNTFCVLFIVVCILCLYKRSSNISQGRAKYKTFDGYLDNKTD